MKHLRTALGAALLGALLPGTASAFDVEPILDSTGEFDLFGGSPTINNDGRVAFFATRDDASQGVFSTTTSPLGPVQVIADTGEGGFVSFPIEPSPAGSPPNGQADINEGGQVAFLAVLAGGEEGIYVRQAGAADPALTEIVVAETASPPPGFSFPEFEAFLSINSSGAVAFTVQDGNNNNTHIFVGDGGTPVCRVGPSFSCLWNTSSVFDSLGVASINDAGTVAFSAGLPGPAEAIATQPGGILCDSLSPCDGFDFNSFGRAAIGPTGAIVFKANLDSGERGIFVYDAGQVCQVVVSASDDYGNAASINADGAVAFVRVAPNLFFNPDPCGATSPIFAAGGAASIGTGGLSDRNRLVFSANPISLSVPGLNGLFISGPDSIPVLPTSRPLLVIGALVAALVVPLSRRFWRRS